MDGFKPHVLGRYNVLRPLGQGGMAEVYLAEQPGAQGFARIVVIKRIRQVHGDDPTVYRMFVDEARLMLSVSHPNVVQVLELQEDDQGLYMALEWVDGSDLMKLWSALRRADQAMPVQLAAYIVGSILRGLGHAHEARDARGEPLGLIHRDVTPSNVLLSAGGQVKLSDFGVAKAKERSAPQTQVGGVKGKLSYMAPEMLSQGRCDQRSDLFSAGVVLWESLTGQRLFAGDQEYAIINALLNKPIPPPRSVRADVPAELEGVVMRALEKTPEKRFQTAREMERALYAFSRDHHPDALSDELSGLIRKHLTVITPAQIAALPRPAAPVAPAPGKRTTQRMGVTGDQTLDGVAQRPPVAGTQAWFPSGPSSPSSPADPSEFFSAPAATPDWMDDVPPAPSPSSKMPETVITSYDDFFGAPSQPRAALPSDTCEVRTLVGVEPADPVEAVDALLRGMAHEAWLRGRPPRTAADVKRWLLAHPAREIALAGDPVLTGRFPSEIPQDFFAYARQGQINGLMLLTDASGAQTGLYLTRGNLDLVVGDDGGDGLAHVIADGNAELLKRVCETILEKGCSIAECAFVSPSQLRQAVDKVNLRKLRAAESSGTCAFAYFTNVAMPAVLPPAMVPFGPQLQGVEDEMETF